MTSFQHQQSVRTDFGMSNCCRTELLLVDIDAVVEALPGRFRPAEAALVERILRDLGRTVPYRQLVEEIGLAIAVHRTRRAKP